jgi:hypothetical protein
MLSPPASATDTEGSPHGSGEDVAGRQRWWSDSPIAPRVAAAAPQTSPQVTPISMTEARQRPVLRPGDDGVWVRRLHRALSIAREAAFFAAATRRAVIAFRTAQDRDRDPS